MSDCYRRKGASGVESQYELLIAQTRQRGDLGSEIAGNRAMSDKDAYPWNAPC